MNQQTEPYYYRDGHAEFGPFEREVFRALVTAGVIRDETLVKIGDRTWQTLGEAGLAIRLETADEVPAQPPPLPVPPVGVSPESGSAPQVSAPARASLKTPLVVGIIIAFFTLVGLCSKGNKPASDASDPGVEREQALWRAMEREGQRHVNEPCSTCSGTGRRNGQCYRCSGCGTIVTGSGYLVTCPDCSGTGKKVYSCEYCNGTGRTGGL